MFFLWAAWTIPISNQSIIYPNFKISPSSIPISKWVFHLSQFHQQLHPDFNPNIQHPNFKMANIQHPKLPLPDPYCLSVFATIFFRNNCVECSSCWRNSMISSFVLTVTLNVCLISVYFGHKNTWYSSSTVSVHNSQVRCSLGILSCLPTVCLPVSICNLWLLAMNRNVCLNDLSSGLRRYHATSKFGCTSL